MLNRGNEPTYRVFDTYMSTELERKFLVDDVAFNNLKYGSKRHIEMNLQKIILQKYLFVSDRLVVRIREDEFNNDTRIQFKLKGDQSGVAEELDIPIDAGDTSAQILLKAILNDESIVHNKVDKIRFHIEDDRVDEGIWEECIIDIFSNVSLNLIEVEFVNVAQMKAFEPLDWFGREVTDDQDYSNETIATLPWDHFINKEKSSYFKKYNTP